MSRKLKKLAVQDPGDSNELSQVKFLAALCIKQQDLGLARATINHLRYGVKYDPQLQKKIDRVVKQFKGVDLDETIDLINKEEDEINRMFKENKEEIENVVSGKPAAARKEESEEESGGEEEEDESEGEEEEEEDEDEIENEEEEYYD